MNIHFYLNDEAETLITSFYDMQSNPFQVGDEVGLDVDELFPVDYNKFKEENQIKMINDNKELEKLFKRKKVKIIREGKYVKFKINSEPKLTIEYHCEMLADKLHLTSVETKEIGKQYYWNRVGWHPQYSGIVTIDDDGGSKRTKGWQVRYVDNNIDELLNKRAGLPEGTRCTNFAGDDELFEFEKE